VSPRDISRVNNRKIVLSVVAIGFAVFCLGMAAWQLRRLSERQAENAFLASRRFGPVLPLDSLPADTAASHFRRVHVTGGYDYGKEIVFTLRGRNGSPGVNILTPLLRNRKDTAVLVNRGWVYRWHHSRSESLARSGYRQRNRIRGDVPHTRPLSAAQSGATPSVQATRPCRPRASLPVSDCQLLRRSYRLVIIGERASAR
jgi:cytochrome oxidase assembly protein ShyY1